MACPTCDHTMQNLGVNGQKIFWCSRCGTLKTVSASFGDHGDYEEIENPIWVRNIIAKANLDTRFNSVSATVVTARFDCRQGYKEPTKLKMELEN